MVMIHVHIRQPFRPKKKRRYNAQQSVRQRMWQAMRILRRFDAAQISATAECPHDSARKLISVLKQFGIVVRSARTEYVLLRDLGPKAPALRLDKALYDHNTNTVMQRIAREIKHD